MLYLRLEPFLRVLRNITGVKSHHCRMLISGGAYYLIVKDKDSEAEVGYRISELSEIGFDIIQFELTKEALVYIGDFGLKLASNLHLEIEQKEDCVIVAIEGYEDSFDCQYIPWDNVLPEDYVEEGSYVLEGIQDLFELYKQSSTASSFVLYQDYGYFIDADIDSVSCTTLSNSTLICDFKLWLNSPKFWYNCLQKFKLEGNSLNIWSGETEALGLYNLLCASFTVKLTSREIVYGQIFYRCSRVTDKWHVVESIRSIYEKLLNASIVQITPERIERQLRIIEAKQLKDTDLMLFRGDTKISVESFKKYIQGKKALTEARVDGNIVLVRTATHDTIFTLHEKVEAKVKVLDE